MWSLLRVYVCKYACKKYWWCLAHLRLFLHINSLLHRLRVYQDLSILALMPFVAKRHMKRCEDAWRYTTWRQSKEWALHMSCLVEISEALWAFCGCVVSIVSLRSALLDISLALHEWLVLRRTQRKTWEEVFECVRHTVCHTISRTCPLQTFAFFPLPRSG